MATYTVHAPPPRQTESVTVPERFLFVRDGFYFWAFVLAPVWLLVRRLWLALLIYVVLTVAIGLGLRFAGVSASVRGVAEFLIALGIGFEASSIWRWTLMRRRWTMLGFVVAEDAEMAERRFFAEWSRLPGSEPLHDDHRATLSEATDAVPASRDQTLPSDVIGLFPEPEAGR